MTRRIVLIAIILLVVLGIAGAIVLTFHHGSDEKVLARAGVALDAENYEKAAELASEYAQRSPDDWRGPLTLGRAQMMLGQYDAARESLNRALELADEKEPVVLALARTYSHPARRNLLMSGEALTLEAIDEAIVQLREAEQLLRNPPDESVAESIEVREALGLNLMYIGAAYELRAEQLEREAKAAMGARDEELRKQKKAEAETANTRKDLAFDAGKAALVEVIREDPQRASAADTLVRFCTDQEPPDDECLQKAREALEPLENASPEAATNLIAYEARKALTASDGMVDKAALADAAMELDKLLEKYPQRIDTLLARADVALEVDDFDTVRTMTDRVLEQDQRQAHARYIRGAALFREGDYAEAEKVLFRLQADFPQFADAHHLYGRALAQRGKREPARGAMRRAIDARQAQDPPSDHPQARRYLAETLYEDHLYEQAYDEAEAFVVACGMEPRELSGKDDPLLKERIHLDYPQALGIVVRAALQLDRPEAAERHLDYGRERLLARPPSEQTQGLLALGDGYAALARFYRAEGNEGQAQAAREEATRLWRMLAERQPGSLFETLATAQAMQRLGRMADAEERLTALVKVHEDSAAVHGALGDHYNAAGRRMLAIEAFREAVRLAPNDTRYRISLAATYYEAGLYKEVEEEVDVLLSQNPQNDEARTLQILSLLAQGKEVPQEEIMQLAASGRRGAGLAAALLAIGRPDEAELVCNEVLQYDASNQAARTLLGQALLTQGRRQACAEQWAIVLEQSPTGYPIYVSLAKLYAQNGTPLLLTKEEQEKEPQDRQQTVYDRLMELDGARSELAQLAVGELLEDRRLYDVAANLYRRVATTEGASDYSRAFARRALARAMAFAGDTAASIRELDELAKVPGWEGRARLQKAQLLGEAGRTDEAIATLERVIADAAERESIGLIRRAILMRANLGQAEQALGDCDKLDELTNKSPGAMQTRAVVLAIAGRKTEAIEQLRIAIEKRPNDFTTRIALAGLLDSEQRHPEALAVFARATDEAGTTQTQALYRKASLLASWGLTRPAADLLLELSEMGYADNPRVQLELGRALAVLRRDGEARKLLAEVPEQAQQYIPAQQALAELAENDDERLAILAELDKKKPDRLATLVQRMRILTEAGRPEEAVKAFDEAMASVEPDARPQGLVAFEAIKALCEAGRMSRAAEEAYKKADQTRLPQWCQTAAVLLMRDDPAKAEVALGLAGDQQGLFGAALHICLAVRQDADASDAYADFTSIVQQLRDVGGGRSVKMTYEIPAAIAAGKMAEAADMAAKSGSEITISRRAAEELAASARVRKDARLEAARLLESAIVSGLGLPDVGTAWALEVLADRPTCLWAGALALSSVEPKTETFRKVVELVRPKDSLIARAAEAAVLRRTGSAAKAAEIYGELAAKERGRVDLMLDQAFCYEIAEMPAKALAIYEAVLQQTQHPIAANNAAYLTVELHGDDPERMSKAIAWVEAAVEAYPQEATFRDTLGWVSYLSGDYEAALQYLRAAVSGLRESPECQYHLGLAESKAGDAQLARWHLQAAVDLVEAKKARGEAVSESAAEAAEKAASELKSLS